MISNTDKRIMNVFSLKLRLSNIVCTILILSTVALATLALLLYHYVVYLRKPLPLWSAMLVVPVIIILAHFSLVALRGLTRGVRSN